MVLTDACIASQTPVPTEADIRRFMPPDLDYVQPRMNDDDDDELQIQSALSKPMVGVQGANDANPQIQTEAQKHSKQLDAKLVAKKQENLNRMQDKFTAYNSQVMCPSNNMLP